MGPLKINVSQAFAGQMVGVKQVEEKIWLVSFMRYDLGFFDHETCRIESAANPFAAKVSRTLKSWSERRDLNSGPLAPHAMAASELYSALPNFPLLF